MLHQLYELASLCLYIQLDREVVDTYRDQNPLVLLVAVTIGKQNPTGWIIFVHVRSIQPYWRRQSAYGEVDHHDPSRPCSTSPSRSPHACVT